LVAASTEVVGYIPTTSPAFQRNYPRASGFNKELFINPEIS
jgi:hypothetical protein